MKFRSIFNYNFTNRGCLHCAILGLQGKRYAIFPSKCSVWDFEDFKNVYTTWNSPEQLAELTQK